MAELIVFEGIGHVMIEVTYALLPLLVFFFIFHFSYGNLPWLRVRSILVGVLLSFVGLSLFLHGVKTAFIPVGMEMGIRFSELEYQWVLIPIGFILGFVATYAEPAVRILNLEIDKATAGYIPQLLMLYTLSIGVGIAISLAMARVIYGIPLWNILIPGYVLVLLLSWFSDEEFTAISFDAGGVATGPMTVTFISAMAIGLSSGTAGSNPLIDGFGMIAIVALAPILCTLLLGFIFKYREKSKETT